MKSLSTLLCVAIVALILPACSTAPKKKTAECCSASGQCEVPAKKKH